MHPVPLLLMGQLLYQLLTFVGPLVYAVKLLDPLIDWRPMSRHNYRKVVASLIYVVVLQEIRFCVDGLVPLVVVCDILKILVVYDPKIGVVATQWLAKMVPWPQVRHFERHVVDPMLRRMVLAPQDLRMTVLHYQLTHRPCDPISFPVSPARAAPMSATSASAMLHVPSHDRDRVHRDRSPPRYVSPSPLSHSPIIHDKFDDDGELIAPTPEEALARSYATYVAAGRKNLSPHQPFTPEYAHQVFNDVFGDERGGHRFRSKIRDFKDRIESSPPPLARNWHGGRSRRGP